MLTSASLAANAQNVLVPNTHKTVVMKFTADWCSPCGTQAWDDFETLVGDSKNQSINAICIAVHNENSDFDAVKLDPSYTAYRPNLVNDQSGIPYFAVSNTIIDPSDVSKIEAAVATETATPADVNTGFLATWNSAGDEVTVNTKTTFFNTASGTYAVGVYMYEDNVFSPQQSRGTGIYPSESVYHHNVLRSPVSGSSVFGTPLTGSNFQTGTSIDNTVIIPKPVTSNQANITLYTITWKDNNGKWEVANANDAASFPAGINNAVGTDVVSGIYPNPATDKLVVALGQSIDRCTINLVDAMGKNVAELYNGQVNKHAIALQLQRPAGIPNGVYFMTINSNKGTQVMKVELR